MTVRDAVIAELQMPGYNDGSIDKALIDAGVDGTSNYTLAMFNSVGLASVAILQNMLGLLSQSESGLNIVYSLAGIQARLNILTDKYGLDPVGGNIISDATHVW